MSSHVTNNIEVQLHKFNGGRATVHLELKYHCRNINTNMEIFNTWPLIPVTTYLKYFDCDLKLAIIWL